MTDSPPSSEDGDRGGVRATNRHRRLLGLEPIFEGGWLHKGKRAQRWDAEDRVFALALFGDVTIDLAEARSTPSEVNINAWAILRDIDVIVPNGTYVELTGRGIFGHLRNEVRDVPRDERERVVRIKGHTLTSDITVRVA